MWGVLCASIGSLPITLTHHSLHLLIEGQAYVLLAFTAYEQGRMLLPRRHYGLDSHVAGYKAGVVATLKLYLLMVPLLLLLVAAIYEVIEGVHFTPLMLNR